MIERVFGAATTAQVRTEAARELIYSLRTTWRSANPPPREDDGLFPLSILSQANRGYLVTVGRQMTGCFSQGWYDASAVMMRRLLEIALIEAFEAKDIAAKVKDAAGDYLKLSDLISALTFRWVMEGWGLIALKLGGASPVGFVSSHTNHNSETRARKWEQTLERTLGRVSAWDWPEVSRVSSRLNRQIRKLAVSKVGSRLVLPDAARLIESGTKLL